jgi:hypothetical protein
MRPANHVPNCGMALIPREINQLGRFAAAS